jgi:hypothetical protein
MCAGFRRSHQEKLEYAERKPGVKLPRQDTGGASDVRKPFCGIDTYIGEGVQTK